MVAVGDLFRERFFRRGRHVVPQGFEFIGYFASLSDVNDYMQREGASLVKKKRRAPLHLG